MRPLLSIRDLTVEFETDDGVVHAVDRIGYDVYPGETLGVVGESGSGKSVSVMSLLRLIPEPPGRIVSGEAIFDGRDLLRIPRSELRHIRGNDIAVVFQDPMTSLNPVFTVGAQIAEALTAHDPTMSGADARGRAIELLGMVGVPQPERRYEQYPHEFSGGMRQRAMIAMAIANQPALLIADEPTTALDVTIQAQILRLLRTAQRETQAGVILITHDLGLIAEMADRVVVMYAGHVVETGDVNTIFHSPRHPYTLGLMGSLPQLDTSDEWLKPIPGNPPNLTRVPPGCPFHPRCLLSRGRERCRTDVPALRPAGDDEHLSACHFSDELAEEAANILAAAEKTR
ncbi:MAG: ATP-binding cassette domain-containing protein [Streptosporangiales bacterium]|nr:ATP-binding cassette domain-containing protein [Streptosporangiales bacterium]